LGNGFERSWIEIRLFRSRAEAEVHALVLAAAGLSYRLVGRDDGVGLLVPAIEADKAHRELAAYDQENRPAVVRGAMPAAAGGLPGAALYCLALAFLHAAAGREAFTADWLSAGSARASRFLTGEWWRAFTALGLHADLGHLLANLALGSVIGLFLAEALGAGLAWLAILLAGAAGNALNALIQPAKHDSIGASTAVFGALGLLVVQTWRHEAARGRRGLRLWLPLAGGIMLLAFLGVEGERTDIGAHLAGFVCGGALGGLLLAVRRVLSRGVSAQLGFGFAAIALFGLAWLFALGVIPGAPCVHCP
jgi:membrane associated rhomboid family serine protease